ncbi:AMP-binding protein [Candidatus Poribacteria bacterium]
MSDLSRNEAIIARHMGPDSSFARFRKEDVEQSIPERFRQQVAKYPDRIAVKTKNYQLTYRELNEAANRMAQAILAQRGEGEEPIALLLEHGTPLITGLLGVLKAGKIYTPLDPSFPQARNVYMLEDSQAGLIVTNNRNISLASGLTQTGRQLLNIDDTDSSFSAEDPCLTISSETFAYIMYTSGSTGRPKGAIHSHRNVLYQVSLYTNGGRICPGDRESLPMSCNFNMAANICLAALLNGASIFPLDLKEEEITSLVKLLIQEEITIYFSIGSIFRKFINTLTGKERFPKLRLFYVGAESLYKTDIDMYRTHFPGDRLLIHTMGATEIGIATWNFIDEKTQIDSSVVPIGHAPEGVEVLLLNEAGEKVSSGQVGEVAVRSRYISRGYWGKPDLTRAKFLPDPDGGDERTYLTGDLGRILPDVGLVHLGRKDSQAKIRGYRVEVAEIETALLNLDSIKEAVVIAKEDHYDNQRLVAYLVSDKQPGPNVTKIRRALAETLPEYMLPSVFVTLAALPLTETGKIDRRSLPVPGTARPELENPLVAPRTPTEETLAAIWAEVLGLEQVGVEDSFFDLGGHSLLATRIVSRTIKEFQVDVPLRSILQSSTVADMAAIVAQNQAKDMGSGDIDRMLSGLEALSDEEIRRLVDNEEIE